MERSATSAAENPFFAMAKRYGNDPVLFAREVLGVDPDPWQDEFLNIVANPKERRISVRSGHGVGKSTAVAMAAIWHLAWRVPGKVVMTAPTSAQLFDALFAEVKRLCRDIKPPFHELFEVKGDRIELRGRAADSFILPDEPCGTAGSVGGCSLAACVVDCGRGEWCAGSGF